MTVTCLSSVPADKLVCGGSHCSTYVDTSAAVRICKCVDPDGQPVDGCKVKTDAYPIETASCYNKATTEWRTISDDACQNLRDGDKNWSWKQCFCCCSCVAWGTQVLVRAGLARSIEVIAIDDPVMAATVTVADGKPVVAWQSRTIIFSDGTTPAEVVNAIRLTWGSDGELVCTGDQPFVLADGRYVAAHKLQAGDAVLDGEGRPVTITGVELGTRTVGLWHIATDAPDQHTMDGHLVSFNGLLAGDFIAQQILGDALRSDPRPILGTEAYAAAAPNGARHHSSLEAEPPPVRSRGFVAYRLIERAPLPSDAVRYVTQQQAEDIRRNAPAAAPTSGYNRANFERLTALYRGFFPQIHIVERWETEEPNLFAFDAFGVKTLLVTGGLLRLTDLTQAGLALILAHGIGRIVGAPPADRAGFACTGQADYFGVGYVVNQAFYGTAFELLGEAIPEIRTLFGYIDADHRGGVDRCAYPSIACRLSAISAARSGENLPHCAGAATPNALKLEAAQVVSVDELSGLSLRFNLPLAPSSIGNVVNYTITPVSSVQHANLDPVIPETVLLTVRFAAQREGDFTVVVRGLRAEDGSTLDPAQATATFLIPAKAGA